MSTLTLQWYLTLSKLVNRYGTNHLKVKQDTHAKRRSHTCHTHLKYREMCGHADIGYPVVFACAFVCHSDVYHHQNLLSIITSSTVTIRLFITIIINQSYIILDGLQYMQWRPYTTHVITIYNTHVTLRV